MPALERAPLGRVSLRVRRRAPRRVRRVGRLRVVCTPTGVASAGVPAAVVTAAHTVRREEHRGCQHAQGNHAGTRPSASRRGQAAR